MSSSDNAYESLVEASDDSRWAFGTGFDDPLDGVDTTMPSGVDGADLATYCLMLADDALVASQRLAQWSTRAPELEEEVALANIGLDLLGQARLLLSRAAAADPCCVPDLPVGSPVPAEDALAFFRDEPAFRNVRLVEGPNGDFARSMARLLLLSTWRLALLHRLQSSRDAVLAAVAAKGVKEVTYHRDHAARWIVTLAQGTDESRRRTVAGLSAEWPHVEELFDTSDVERLLAAAGVAVDPADVREEFVTVLAEVLVTAGLDTPQAPAAGGPGGRDGRHTEAMGPLLAELQVVARAHPSGRW
jgi:ring-1,2-phenylacetyl-CoA epoxidase subunit PaaC